MKKSLQHQLKKVENLWEQFFSDGLIYAHKFDEYWVAFKNVYLKNSFKFDIQKTNSIVSPYNLFISFRALSYQNDSSPKANGNFAEDHNQWYGFKTAAEAFAHTSLKDMGNGNPWEYSAKYLYKKGNWILKDGNQGLGILLLRVRKPPNKINIDKVNIIPVN